MYNSSARQEGLDSLRGLAALQVMLTHYISAFYPYAVFGKQGQYLQKSGWEGLLFFPPLGLLSAGHFAVCLFFVLSGYVLSYPYLGERDQGRRLASAIVKRPFRLGGLVLLTIALSACLWATDLYFNREAAALTGSRPWFECFWPGKFNFTSMLNDVSTSMFARAGSYNPPLWTIKIELYGSMYVFLFLMFLRACKYRMLFILGLLVILRNSPYFGFFAGVFFADIIKTYQFASLKKVRTGLALLSAGGFLYLSSYPGYVNSAFLETTIYGGLPPRSAMFVGYPMLAAVLAFAFVLISRPIQIFLARPALVWLGHLSYSVYALHFLILGSLSAWIFSRWMPILGHDAAFVLVIGLSFPLTLLLSVWVKALIDEPASRFGQYIGQKFTMGGQYRAKRH